MMIKYFRLFKSVISAQRKRQVDAALLDLSRKNSGNFYLTQQLSVHSRNLTSYFPPNPIIIYFFPMYLMDLKIWTSFKNWNNMVWMYCVLTDQILWIIRNRYCILWIPDWGFIIKWKVDEEIVKIPQENLQKDLFTTAYTVTKSASAANANAWTHTNDPVSDYHCISKFEGCFIAIIRWWSWKHTKYSKNVLIVPLF